MSQRHGTVSTATARNTKIQEVGSWASGSHSDRLRQLRDALGEGLVERELAVRLSLLAALSGEHLLFIGPPGTAKSLVARRLRLAFTEAGFFERLLTRFTVPEELFGPLSIKGLEEDRYERLTEGYLPTASVAFLDEIFKANSAILNALLTVLNEREFDNGAQRTEIPLIAVIGASNELPEGEELAALHDRFLLRLHVGPVSGEGFRQLLTSSSSGEPQAPEKLKLPMSYLRWVQDEAARVSVPEDVISLITELREWCAARDLSVSDRRWRKVVKLLQVSAFTCGRKEVSVWDCWLLQHCLWAQPDQRAEVYEWYAARVGARAALDPSRITRLVASWRGQLKSDQEGRAQAQDRKGRLLYQGADGEATTSTRGDLPATRGQEPLFLCPPEDRNGRTVHDRANGGEGYTKDELDEFTVRGTDGYACYFSKWSHRASYLENRGNRLLVEGDLPPVMEPTRFSTAYIERCLAQIDQIATGVKEYRAHVEQHLEGLRAEIDSHLWVTPEFFEPAATSLHKTKKKVASLVGRLDDLREGYETLPRSVSLAKALANDDQSADETTAPDSPTESSE